MGEKGFSKKIEQSATGVCNITEQLHVGCTRIILVDRRDLHVRCSITEKSVVGPIILGQPKIHPRHGLPDSVRRTP